jgi:predicted RecA/RadA family phage recombinase
MKNYVQPGNVATVAAPYDVASGAGLKVGALFGVATVAALSGQALEAQLAGVFDLAKATGQAWSVGDKLYWDDTNKNCTTTASGNTLIGVALAAAVSGATTGRVRLNGSF